MKTKAKFSMFVAACALLFSSLPVVAGPANSPQTEGTTETQSVQKGEKQKGQASPGKDVGKGSEDIGKGAGKGAESLGKGTAGAAGNLVTLHPGHAAGDLGKGAAGAGKDVGVGTGKGAAKIGKGSARGIGKLGKKLFGRGGKNKKELRPGELTAPNRARPGRKSLCVGRPVRCSRDKVTSWKKVLPLSLWL